MADYKLDAPGALQRFNDPRESPEQTWEEPLYPVVQLKFGKEDFVVTIPPEYLQELEVTSKLGIETTNFVFTDPSFGRIERRVFEVDRDEEPLLYRWGYPGNGLERSFWGRLQIVNMLPTLSHSGIRITLEGKAVGTEFAVISEPKVYVGRISNVVKEIALDMGFAENKITIEETDDDQNEERSRAWPTNNLTRIDMIHKLAEQAKSKKNPNRTYDFRLGSDGTFNFNTADLDTKQQEFRVFKVLYGIPTGVVEFTPRYSAKTLGNFARQAIARTFDPSTKRFIQRTINRDTLGMSGPNDPSKGKTSGSPISKKTDSIATQRGKANSYVYEESSQIIRVKDCIKGIMDISRAPDQALNKIENAWKTLQRSIGGGTLELLGLPPYTGLSAKDYFYDMQVILPAVSEEELLSSSLIAGFEIGSSHGTQIRLSGNELHWSSGRYHVESVRHYIATGYNITVEMDRFMHMEGPDDAKTGPPKKATE